MGRFIEGCDRHQRLLLPDCVDDYVDEASPVRVVDVFIDELDLPTLGFAGSASTGRPGYHPATMLKLYLYGYLNQVQSSRKLERETGRNIEVMWLTGKLSPDFKTIADFRRDNGAAIRAVCRQFVVLCRRLGLVSGGTVAVDGSRMKATNTRDKNFTPGAIRRRMEQVDASIERYLSQLDTADRQEDEVAEMRTTRLTERIDALRRQRRELQAMEKRVETSPDRQISLTDPDARAMATHGKGTGLVGYNTQAAVDAGSHIIVTHEVTNLGHDRTQLASMGRQAKDATGVEDLTVLADRGYFSGAEVLACEALGITAICPKPLTSGARAEGRFGKPDFIYQPDSNTYLCPAGETLPKRSTSIEHGLVLNRYWSSNCRQCRLKPDCTVGTERRITRWEHEHVVEAMQDRLDRMPEAMRIRRRTVEHVFGTIKDWMGRSHFKTRRLRNVKTEMSLHVLAYNLKRAIALVGANELIAAMRDGQTSPHPRRAGRLQNRVSTQPPPAAADVGLTASFAPAPRHRAAHRAIPGADTPGRLVEAASRPSQPLTHRSALLESGRSGHAWAVYPIALFIDESWPVVPPEAQRTTGRGGAEYALPQPASPNHCLIGGCL